MPLPDRLRLPFDFDPALLARDLEGLRAVGWIKHYVQQNYDGDWSVIALRGKAGATHPVMMIYADPICRDFADTPMLAACPYFRQVLDTFEAPLRAVRLMRLTAGSVIKEHTDHELSFEEGTVRIHVPVVTNAEVEFYLNRNRVVLEAGSSWYLRLSDPHSVANRGTADRVHMVIDAEVNEWVRRVLETAATLATAERSFAAAAPAAPAV
jgi:Aspartyl/Asparaginyl beta-hydroxylase